jgi:uncharacterized protein (TIGR02569 family)
MVKLVDDEVEAAYVAGVVVAVPEDGFRLSRPMRSDCGRWVEDGWCAWTYAPGEHAADRWPEIMRTGTRFNRILRAKPCPSHLSRRRHPWTIGDLLAFGEDTADVPEPMRSLIAKLQSHLRPLQHHEPQLIHGDLTGNVLFHDPEPPLIIDFTPFYRPAGYATAIVAIDAMVWHGADRLLMEHVEPAADRHQLLARAAIFRMVSGALHWQHDVAEVERETRAYTPLAEDLMARIVAT